MTIKKYLFTLVLCCWSVWSLMAQLTLGISDVTGQQGETVEVGVYTTGFADITSMQFSVNWDSTVLAFKGVGNLTEELPAFTDKEIGLVETPSGAMRVAWFDNTIQGVSLPDSTQLFIIKFAIIGEVGSNSSISISDSPIVIEFSTLDGSMIDLSEVTGGNVVIQDNSTSLSYLVASNGMELHQNEPNPFKQTTFIKAVFPKSEMAQFFVTNAAGKKVYESTFKSTQGENTIEIGRHLLTAPGIYYYTLQTREYQLSRKMIVLP